MNGTHRRSVWILSEPGCSSSLAEDPGQPQHSLRELLFRRGWLSTAVAPTTASSGKGIPEVMSGFKLTAQVAEIFPITAFIPAHGLPSFHSSGRECAITELPSASASSPLSNP